MEADASEHAPRETGGMLVGYRSTEGDEVVTGVIIGGPRAMRRSERFVGDGEWQQARLDKVYLESGGVITYLGEWHSHPAGLLKPSRLDRRTARRIARKRAARAPRPLMIIGVTDGDGWRWRAFRHSGWRSGLREVELTSY
jgi:integrative and conjugative element protein (TIGR02256 family)